MKNLVRKRTPNVFSLLKIRNGSGVAQSESKKAVFLTYMYIPFKRLEHIVRSFFFFFLPLRLNREGDVRRSNTMAHLDKHTLLSDKQYVFRKWHCCETQLTTVIDDWASFRQPSSGCNFYIGFGKKTFDTSRMNS